MRAKIRELVSVHIHIHMNTHTHTHTHTHYTLTSKSNGIGSLETLRKFLQTSRDRVMSFAIASNLLVKRLPARIYSMYVCMYVCVCLCVYVCVCVCMYACVCMYMCLLIK